MTTRSTTAGPLLVGALVASVVLAPAVAAGQRARQRGEPASGKSSAGNGDTGRVAVPRSPRGSSGGSSRPATTPDSGSSRDTTRDTDRRRVRVPPYSRPRGDNEPVGDAATRRDARPVGGSSRIVVRGRPYDYGGFYPWGYGGFGLGGYWGGRYYPGYSGYDYAPYDPAGYQGAIRLKVKPVEAEVFVDGYYAGRVDDFDGIFQRLRIEVGPHRIEVREEGYEPLTLEVRILPDHTITYEAELKPLVP